jgi:hypothetical protein
VRVRLGVALVSLFSVLSAASPADARDTPAAPLFEYGVGVGTTIAAEIVVLLPTYSACERSSSTLCGTLVGSALLVASAGGAAGGVVGAGSFLSRNGSIPGAFAGSAAGTLAGIGGAAVVASATRSKEGGIAALLLGTIFMPSLGATIGYEAFRSTPPQTAARASMLVVGPVRF